MRSSIDNPRQFFRSLPWQIAQTRYKLGLLQTLVRRELEAKYKGSVLGNAWPLLHQFFQLVIFTFVFSLVLRVRPDNNDFLPGMPENLRFAVWLLAGLLPWTAFSNGLSQASAAVIGQPNLVKKVVFPLALLPLVPVCTAFIESFLGLGVLILFIAIVAGGVPPLLWVLPGIAIPQFLLAAGLGYVASSLTVFLRDVPQGLGVLLNLWFYATPIVYPAAILLRQNRETLYHFIFLLNPMAAIAELYREAILFGAIAHAAAWGRVCILSVAIFSIGLWCYRRLRPGFADVL